ncbi:hypothetical protein QVD17_35403 [Tagetes erecta]|uniref:Protein kinase domain-containing protein n=1 Tax=Tagetes erecta TaxID=13708 RepID=A0AAD8NLZ1_TARER|nr:hypothetical protein QVD17_35403 [Tagetes erecta]
MSTVSSYWSQISYFDLVLATRDFADKNLLTTDSSFKVYKGKHFDFGHIVNIVARRHPHEQTFYNELNICRFLKHKNIVPIYYIFAHKDVRFIVTKHEANGSLKKHLSGPTLTWMQRLHICVQSAHALKYLHYDIEDDHYIIHGNIGSSKFLLDQNWETKLHDFRYAVIAKKQILHQTGKYNGSLHYMDPEYEKTAGLTDKSDVFSFGVVLFEVLFGREACIQSSDNLYFVRLARSHYEERKLDELIDPDLRKQMNLGSLNIFAETAYYCIKEKRSQRQNMNQVVSKLEEALKLQSKHVNFSFIY